jgi:drug/metabolite transporter (DMT)-like permease
MLPKAFHPHPSLLKARFVPLYLLFPLFSSVVFVLGMMLAKQAIDLGVTPWTGTFFANVWLALFWAGVAIVRGEVLPVEAWGDAALIGLLFVLGQLFTYLAFQFGDVSVATPVFGVKVLMVAALTSLLAGINVPANVWAAGAMACVGIILIQWSSGPAHANARTSRRGLTIILALGAAFCLSLFDVFLQEWVGSWNSYAFLPVMFGAAGILSLVFLPKVDGPKRLRELKATRWMLAGTLLMATQAMSMCYALAEFGDAPRINIVYALRGLWGVVLAWLLARTLGTNEATLSRVVMLRRLAGALLLTAAVFTAIAA